jgi:hypothetical protein
VIRDHPRIVLHALTLPKHLFKFIPQEEEDADSGISLSSIWLSLTNYARKDYVKFMPKWMAKEADAMVEEVSRHS